MKRVISLILCVVSALIFVLSAGGCNGDKDKAEYNGIKQEEYLLGVGNLTSEQLPAYIDSKVDNQWSADKIGALGAKSTRIWLYLGYYVGRESKSNNIYLKQGNCDILHDYIAKMKEQGVERFMGMIINFITPFEFNCSDKEALPSAYDDYDVYVKFLGLMGKTCALLAQEFPEIQYWEIGNEPDIEHASWFHKKGYSGRNDDEHKFTHDELAYISADLCWYAYRAIKEIRPEDKVVLPGLVGNPDVLEWIYKFITQGYLPTAEEYSDRNPDNYFDILCWHVYPTSANEFVKINNEMYQVAIDYGDEGKPVFLSEFGFSDFRFGGVEAEHQDLNTEGVQKKNANRAIQCLDAIKEELPYIETVFFFRLSNIAQYYDAGSQENSFGLFYSPNDTDEWASKPKPIAIELFKYFNGQNADVSVLYKYVVQ